MRWIDKNLNQLAMELTIGNWKLTITKSVLEVFIRL